MLDRDLAELYGVEVKRLKEQVKRNIDRFPLDFYFQLTKREFQDLILKSQIATSSFHGGIRKMPYVFTEHGVTMLAAVLRSDTAIKVSVLVVRAFVSMRKTLTQIGGVIQRLEIVEQKQITTDKKVDKILNALDNKEAVPNRGVFFNGQIFDAYVVANKIIKSAKQSIILIDNYIDETVLTILAKKSKNVKVTLLTKDISKQLKLDIVKFNQQYPASLEAKNFNLSHDRFLIIDNKDVYHLGASLKDLGKKWFAFSKMGIEGLDLLGKIKN
jgi:hypothetical protein